ncbi:hypothetical protein GQ600_17394 [Phytophthora cactorum]|nr:hypothetical protein GQ600_17394 [Phytophthora cactorum]
MARKRPGVCHNEREKSVDYEAIEKSLETLGNYHDQLGGEVMGIPASLDSTLLLHGLVALVVQNVLMVVQKRGWIYDEMAFALTATTAFVHVIVLLTAKYVVLHCFGDMNGAFMKTQQRGAKLMEDIWLDIDRFEPEQLIVGASKKKKAKSKSRASASRTTGDYSSAESALQNNRPVFKRAAGAACNVDIGANAASGFATLALCVRPVFVGNDKLHVLWTLGQVRRKVLSRSTIGSAAQKLKSE